MLQHPSKLFALTALVAAIGAGPATAGGYSCCACADACAPVVVAPPPQGPFHIVNQGPDYTGPGIVLVPGPVVIDTAPATYPYVGRDYDYPLYPAVRHHHHARPLRHHVHREDVRWHRPHRVHVSERWIKHAPRYNPKRPFDPNDK
jgi:hypothetical protein